MDTSETGNQPLGSSNQRINVHLRVTKEVALTVERTEAVEKLKAALCEKEGPSYYVQELSLDGKHLLDHETLHDLGIESNATLDAVLGDFRRLFVRIPTEDRIVVVQARADDPLHKVRSMITSQGGIQSDKFSLFHGGTILEEDGSLFSLGITDNSILHLVFPHPDVLLSVFVKAPDGQMLKLKVRAMFTIADVKVIAGSMLGIGIKLLSCRGKQLEDSRSLYSYSIKDGYILQVMSMSFQIFVKTWSGKTIALDVHSQNTIADVKNMNYQRLAIPAQQQSLVYGGRILENGRILMSYNIGKHCTLSMVLGPSSMVIPFKVSEIEDTSVDHITISALKEIIQERRGLTVKEILYRDTVLSDDLSLKDHGIVPGMELSLVCKSVPGMKLSLVCKSVE